MNDIGVDILSDLPDQLSERTRVVGPTARQTAGEFVLWIARNDSKPERGGQESWVLHASPEWTSQYLEDGPADVLPQLIDSFWQATDLKPAVPFFGKAHLWRYAIPPEPLESRSLFDSQLCLGACGDWCSGPRVEGAFLSGMAMAGNLLAHIGTC